MRKQEKKTEKNKGKLWKKVILTITILILFTLVYFSGATSYLTFENLQNNKEILQQNVHQHYLLFVLIFIIVYIISVALSLPGAAILTITGGFLFGAVFGPVFVNIGATIGATGAFLASRYLLGDWIHTKHHKKVHKFNKAVDEHGHHYLLSARLMPIFPFFLVNMLAGLTKIPLRTFVWTTAIGIFPGSFVYAFAGTQLSTISSINDILSLPIFLALLLLGNLALLPAGLKHLKSRSEAKKRLSKVSLDS